MTQREQLVELINKLFIYTDTQDWDGLTKNVFDEIVFLDMSSLGGPAENFSATDICNMWKEGFKDLDSVNHLGGNYLVKITSVNEADIFAYATATHYKASATNGHTREFVGTYELKARRIDSQWKIYSFVYNLKYMTGNTELK